MLMPGFPSPAAHHSGAYRPFGTIGAYALNAGKLAALLLFFLLAGCHRTPPEQALRDTIAKMQSAGETGDLDALFEPIAEDFSGSGNMNREAFQRYVTLMSLRSRQVGVTLGPVEVKLYGERASARFTAAITGGPGLLPSQAQVYAIDTGWRLEDGEWKLINATWKEQL